VHLQQLQLAFCLLSNFLDKTNKPIPITATIDPKEVSAWVSGVEIIDSPNQAKPDNIKRTPKTEIILTHHLHHTKN